MKKNILIALLYLGVSVVFAQVDYKDIVQKLDDLQDFKGVDLSMEWTIVSLKPGEDKSVTRIQIFRRDIEDQALYLILEPEVDKGQGYLMSGDNGFMYDPSSRKFSHFSLKENIGDSDAQHSDVRSRSYVNDYNIIETDEGIFGRIECYIITLEAKTNEVTTPKLKIWVRKDRILPMKMEEYSLSNRLVRTIIISKWIDVEGKYISSTTLIQDNLKTGEKTQLTVDKASVKKIPDKVFTKGYLETVNNK